MTAVEKYWELMKTHHKELDSKTVASIFYMGAIAALIDSIATEPFLISTQLNRIIDEQHEKKSD